MLFDRQITRLPDHYPRAQTFIEAMQDGFWTAKKFHFDSDKTDFELNLTEQERVMLTRVLAAIAQIEVAVKKFWVRLGDHLPHPSITDLGITMGYIEVIHNNAYEKLLKKLGLTHVFEENMKVPALAGRVGYLTKHSERNYSDDRRQFIYSLILFTLFVENVSLFSQFYVVLNLNRFKGVLKDTAQQVKYTRNEELLHAQAGMWIINTLRAEYPELFDEELERKIKHECHVALGAECELINWMVGDYQGEKLNAELLKGYVAQRLNESLEGIGYEPVFHVTEEVKKETFWMTEGLLAPAKVDFFHSEPTAYTQADTPDDDNW
ncbi:ribonucleotide-diphosphate reductase subunit beta [Ancylobacter rudongensis]|uniref:ribonucleoside-diphosphate reductase n=1 Tax=Ancylobacter rudongensis TaxID=177413 RepID=A0A1G4UQR2_9HYPH|nr:ribonucleotide-diphosphate reductase subunit beta [Ancylobacter rudongensis]SCW95864.1 ribonucleoside-diphosphate reductase beta chain [Ancylobacter rudongensis]